MKHVKIGAKTKRKRISRTEDFIVVMARLYNYNGQISSTNSQITTPN